MGVQMAAVSGRDQKPSQPFSTLSLLRLEDALVAEGRPGEVAWAQRWGFWAMPSHAWGASGWCPWVPQPRSAQSHRGRP